MVLVAPTSRRLLVFHRNSKTAAPSCKLVHSQNSGAAPFTVFVKGAGFSSLNHPPAKKGQIGIGWRERRRDGRKTRTLEHHKDAAPNAQELSKVGSPARSFKSLVACKLTRYLPFPFGLRYRQQRLIIRPHVLVGDIQLH